MQESRSMQVDRLEEIVFFEEGVHLLGDVTINAVITPQALKEAENSQPSNALSEG
jgi:hypothetical protein